MSRTATNLASVIIIRSSIDAFATSFTSIIVINMADVAVIDTVTTGLTPMTVSIATTGTKHDSVAA